MNKILKMSRYILFIIFVTILIGTIEVEAKTCVYDYEWTSYNVKTQAHVEFDVTNGDSRKMLFQPKKSYLKYETIAERSYTIKYKGSFSKEDAGEGKCPVIYFHPEDPVSTGSGVVESLTVFAKKSDCKNFWFFGCKDSSLHPVEGTLQYETNEEKECTDEEKREQFKKYNEEILRFYAMSEEIETYKSEMMNAITNQQSVSDMESKINAVIDRRRVTHESSLGQMANIKIKYNCLDENTYKTDIDNIQKLFDNGTDALTEYKNELLDQEKKRWEEDEKNTEEFNELKERTDGYADTAKEKVAETAKKAKELKITELGTILSPNCNNLLGNVVAHIQQVFDWIKIIAPLLLVIYGSIDYANAVIANDNDALKKATNKFVKRAIAAVAIFFLPLIINLLLNLPGIKDTINMGNDPLCGISRVVIK